MWYLLGDPVSVGGRQKAKKRSTRRHEERQSHEEHEEGQVLLVERLQD
jgi:hypothetical protein